VNCLLGAQAGLLERNGFAPLARPRFYGPKEKFAALEGIAEYAEELKGTK